MHIFTSFTPLCTGCGGRGQKRAKKVSLNIYNPLWTQQQNGLDQCFTTFVGSRHPIRLKKIGGILTWLKCQFGPPIEVKKKLKVSKFNILRHLWHLLTAPFCAAAPRLGMIQWFSTLEAYKPTIYERKFSRHTKFHNRFIYGSLYIFKSARLILILQLRKIIQFCRKS